MKVVIKLELTPEEEEHIENPELREYFLEKLQEAFDKGINIGLKIGGKHC